MEHLLGFWWTIAASAAYIRPCPIVPCIHARETRLTEAKAPGFVTGRVIPAIALVNKTAGEGKVVRNVNE